MLTGSNVFNTVDLSYGRSSNGTNLTEREPRKWQYLPILFYPPKLKIISGRAYSATIRRKSKELLRVGQSVTLGGRARRRASQT